MNAGGGQSGFLARIVNRAHGEATSVAPRLPGLFEPVFAQRPLADSMHSGGTVADTLETESGSRLGRFADERPSIASNRSQEVFDARPVRMRSAERDDTTPASKPPAPRLPSTLPAIVEPVARAPILASVAELQPRAVRIASPVHEPESASSKIDPRHERKRRDASDASTLHEPATRTAAAPPTLPAAELPHSVLMPKFVPIETARTDIRNDSERRQTESTQARSEPAVHISIGRIEVRAATQPATPAARTQRTQRPMSLDEYLERKERAR